MKPNQLMHDVAKPETLRAQVKSRRKAIWISIASVVGVIVLLLLIKGLQIMTMISAGKKMVPPPETVTSAVVKEEDWAPTLRSVGSISPVQGAVISAELAGVVSQVEFENGGDGEERRLVSPTRCLGGRSTTAFRGSRFATGAGRLGPRS